MKTLRIVQTVLALTLVVGISSNSFAFMLTAATQPAAKAINPTQLAASLRAEIAAGETECEAMLAKLNAALNEIDARLDIGVPNEDEHLAARRAIADMRYDLECVAQTLTAQVIAGGGAAAAGAAAGAAPAVTGFGAAGAAGAGVAGAGAAGGGSLGSLAGLGIIGGGVAAVAGNGDAPGFVASQSVAN